MRRTGDLLGVVAQGHHCLMYRWSGLEALLKRYGTIVDASATGCLVIQNEEAVQELENDPRKMETFLQWEVEYCREPGTLDSGTHIIAVLQK